VRATPLLEQDERPAHRFDVGRQAARAVLELRAKTPITMTKDIAASRVATSLRSQRSPFLASDPICELHALGVPLSVLTIAREKQSSVRAITRAL